MLSHSRGGSLVEALLASLVVSIGMLGLAKLQTQFLFASQNTRNLTAASHFAQQKLEALRAFASLHELDANSSGEDECDPKQPGSFCFGLNSPFKRKWTVSACPNAVPCEQITAEVVWGPAQGAKQKVVLSSYFARQQPVQSGLLLFD